MLDPTAAFLSATISSCFGPRLDLVVRRTCPIVAHITPVAHDLWRLSLSPMNALVSAAAAIASEPASTDVPGGALDYAVTAERLVLHAVHFA